MVLQESRLNKQESRTLPCLLHHLLPLSSCPIWVSSWLVQWETMMWKCKPNTTPLPQLACWSWCFIITTLTLTASNLVLGVGSYCNKSNYVLEACGRTLKCKLEKSLSGESPVSYSVGLEDKNVESRAEDRSLHCEVTEESVRSLSGIFPILN